jgi:hypothetical protein
VQEEQLVRVIARAHGFKDHSEVRKIEETIVENNRCEEEKMVRACVYDSGTFQLN